MVPGSGPKRRSITPILGVAIAGIYYYYYCCCCCYCYYYYYYDYYYYYYYYQGLGFRELSRART